MDANGNAVPFTSKEQDDLVSNVIEPMASDGLRTICIAYKDYVERESCFSLIYLDLNLESRCNTALLKN